MNDYINLVEDILVNGSDVDTRSGKCRMLTHKTLSFDLSDGFPRLTNRYVPFKSVAVELEGFIGGITSKKWYQDRGCNFWDSWANPKEVIRRMPELAKLKNRDDFVKHCMKIENDLGPIYGYNWRRFNQKYIYVNGKPLPPFGQKNLETDQLAKILETLMTAPNDRRMYVSSWNPQQIDQMALPPCHISWKVDVIDGKLDLFFHMRSWDVYLGGPANIQSYAILNHLLSRHANLKPGKLTVFASNVHLYHNLLPQCEELIKRPQHELPEIKFKDYGHFWNWTHEDIECIDYKHSGKLAAEVSL